MKLSRAYDGAALTEPERRVLRGEGQPGCAVCEQARRDLLKRGYDVPELHPRPHEH